MHWKYAHIYHFGIFDNIYICHIGIILFSISSIWHRCTGIFLTPMWRCGFLVPKFVRGIMAGKFQESSKWNGYWNGGTLWSPNDIYISICSHIQKPYDISSYHWIKNGCFPRVSIEIHVGLWCYDRGIFGWNSHRIPKNHQPGWWQAIPYWMKPAIRWGLDDTLWYPLMGKHRKTI